jgi:secreted trypsin-like serine protease
VSWGRRYICGHPDYPALYTKVSAVRHWIKCICNAEIQQTE